MCVCVCVCVCQKNVIKQHVDLASIQKEWKV